MYTSRWRAAAIRRFSASRSALASNARVIEERARGDAARADEIRRTLKDRVGADLSAVKPGAEQAAALKTALIADGLWSQYLEVAIGPDAEIFTKAPILSSVGWGDYVGVRSDSAWNNPEPEVAVVCDSTGRILGAMTIAGTLTVGGATFTVTINGTLTLETMGTLNNPGTVQVGQFVNNGGTINGNPPVLLSPGQAPLRIEGISLTDAGIEASGPNDVRAAGAERTVTLKWHATPGDRFVIESTTDLRAWVKLPAVITESSLGSFEAALPAEGADARFYRLRRF